MNPKDTKTIHLTESDTERFWTEAQIPSPGDTPSDPRRQSSTFRSDGQLSGTRTLLGPNTDNRDSLILIMGESDFTGLKLLFNVSVRCISV